MEQQAVAHEPEHEEHGAALQPPPSLPAVEDPPRVEPDPPAQRGKRKAPAAPSQRSRSKRVTVAESPVIVHGVDHDVVEVIDPAPEQTRAAAAFEHTVLTSGPARAARATGTTVGAGAQAAEQPRRRLVRQPSRSSFPDPTWTLW